MRYPLSKREQKALVEALCAKYGEGNFVEVFTGDGHVTKVFADTSVPERAFIPVDEWVKLK